jgi:hypothetical protein
MTRARPPVLAQQAYRANAQELERLDLSEKFRYIYRTNMWGAAESTSGVGSTLDSTEATRRGIAEICREFRVDSLLDAPCGDASWIAAADLPISRYFGVDIVPELIADNMRRYAGRGFEFAIADLTKDALPQCDLILCRDCLVHLSFVHIEAVLSNFRRSGARYLLTTMFPECEQNLDANDGDWRMLNLELKPFRFPPPLKLINEECDEMAGAYRDKSLGLWELQQIAQAR